MTVTRFMLDWTRDQRPELRTEMHLTPGGNVEAEVNESQRLLLEESIRLQEKLLERARTAMRAERVQRFSQGLSKAHFNVAQEIKP
jgi:hypothetical protein